MLDEANAKLAKAQAVEREKQLAASQQTNAASQPQPDSAQAKRADKHALPNTGDAAPLGAAAAIASAAAMLGALAKRKIARK